MPLCSASNFWSVLVYDTLSRSALQNGQPFPSVSSYTDPLTNSDSSIDILFGPEEPTKATMASLAVLCARELARWSIETTIVMPGAFTKETNHFAHSGRPDDYGSTEVCLSVQFATPAFAVPASCTNRFYQRR